MDKLHEAEMIDHSQLISLVRTGHALVGVDPAVARRVLTDSDSEILQGKAGESLSFERALVRLTFISSWIFLLVSMGLAVKVFGWWSTLVVPLSFVGWGLCLRQASLGNQRFGPTLSFLLLSVAACFLPKTNLSFQVWLVLVAVAFFLIKATYFAATMLLRSLVVRNERAYNFLEGNGVHIKLADDVIPQAPDGHSSRGLL